MPVRGGLLSVLVEDGTRVDVLPSGAIRYSSNPAAQPRWAMDHRHEGQPGLSSPEVHQCFDRETCHEECPAFGVWSARQEALRIEAHTKLRTVWQRLLDDPCDD